jgi:hypothetical protein
MSDEELHEIAQALEPHFPGWSLDWDPANRPRYALFVNEEGAGMYVELSRCTDPPRLVVHGRYFLRTQSVRSYYPEPKARPRITVSSARSIAAIAADIQRRFIPHYLEAFARVCERKRRAEERERQEAAIRAELAAILGEEVSGDGVIRYRSDRGGGYTYGRVEVSGDQVKLDISGIPAETACAICCLLRGAGSLAVEPSVAVARDPEGLSSSVVMNGRVVYRYPDDGPAPQPARRVAQAIADALRLPVAEVTVEDPWDEEMVAAALKR